MISPYVCVNVVECIVIKEAQYSNFFFIFGTKRIYDYFKTCNHIFDLKNFLFKLGEREQAWLCPKKLRRAFSLLLS